MQDGSRPAHRTSSRRRAASTRIVQEVYVLADFVGKMASAVALFVYLAAFGIRTV